MLTRDTAVMLARYGDWADEVLCRMTDDQKLTAIRDGLPFLKKGIYVDNAAVSLVSRRVRRAKERYHELIVEELRDLKSLAQPII